MNERYQFAQRLSKVESGSLREFVGFQETTK